MWLYVNNERTITIFRIKTLTIKLKITLRGTQTWLLTSLMHFKLLFKSGQWKSKLHHFSIIIEISLQSWSHKVRDIAGHQDTSEVTYIAGLQDVSDVRDLERIWIIKSFLPIRVTPEKSPIFSFSLSPFCLTNKSIPRFCYQFQQQERFAIH